LLADRYDFDAPFLFFCVTMAFTFILVWVYVPQPVVAFSKDKLTIPSVLTDYCKMLRKPVYRSVAVGYMLMF